MSAQRRFSLVIALDDSEYSEIVLEHALDQAMRQDSPDLHFLTVVDDSRTDLEQAKTWLVRAVIEGLETFHGRPDWRTRIHVRRGKPADEIAALASEVDARMIVVGRYGTHHRLHSVADRVIAKAPCSTLVVGLSGREVDAEAQCPECVRTREDSGGDRWFCEPHLAPDRSRLSSLIPMTTSNLRGGVW